MANTSTEKTCLVTGATGFLGGRVSSALAQRGWCVVGLSRRPQPGLSTVAFRLGDEVATGQLSGAGALVHCAYDFKASSRVEIQAVNVAGSEKLFRAARQAKVGRLIYISSISAFEGCRSLYGQAKLEIERLAFSFGATVIRPGLIWGRPPGAMFGKLVDQAGRAKILPLITGGRQFQYLAHEQDLCDFICRCAEARVSPPSAPVTVANEQPWKFRAILEEIARAKNKRLFFIPVPWRMVWAALKMAELGRVPLNFRSDNLVSFIYQNPNPSFAEQRQLGVTPRPFSWTK